MERAPVTGVEEEVEGLSQLSPRRRARVIALQTLYEVDCVNHVPERCLAWLLHKPYLTPEIEAFAWSLVRGVGEQENDLDLQIQNYAPAWPLNQLAVVDRNLLRLAIYECTSGAHSPPKVAINEAVELAKLFGGESSARFINGVLGSVMEQHKQEPVP
ncbi:MAG: transcription antitermination factor NusB [Chloroflexi bacterium]|nr:transcription antitermination factor NusB [Chloroflexota bacterium]